MKLTPTQKKLVIEALQTYKQVVLGRPGANAGNDGAERLQALVEIAACQTIIEKLEK